MLVVPRLPLRESISGVCYMEVLLGSRRLGLPGVVVPRLPVRENFRWCMLDGGRHEVLFTLSIYLAADQ